MSVKLYRRRFFQLATVWPFILESAAKAAQDTALTPPIDHGIGGTGQSLSGENDHGIGGTGVFGTIQRFGSIFVNGYRITYPSAVPVFMDGVRADARALRLGQVVRVALAGSFEDPLAHAIHVTSEVVGPTKSISKGEIVVLAQTIELTPNTSKPALEAGMNVAVYGIRRPDGTIVASRIEKRSRRSRTLLRGIAASQNGRLKVGNLVMDIAAGPFMGRRVLVELGRLGKTPLVQSVRLEELVPGLSEGRISIETYGEKKGGSVSVGVGTTVEAAALRSFTVDGHGYVDISVKAGGLVSAPNQNEQHPQTPSAHQPSGASQPDRGGPGPGFGGARGPPK